MPKRGYYSLAEVELSGLPYWTGSHWIGRFKDLIVLLSKSRCKEFGYPVQTNEKPAAFRYAKSGPGEYKYIPVYDRTSCFIDDRLLHPFEFVE